MRLMIIPSQASKITGKCKIYLELTHNKNGKRTFKRIDTHQTIEAKYWNQKKQEVKSTHPQANKINSLINQFKYNYQPEQKEQRQEKSLVYWLDHYIEYRKSKGTKRTSWKEFFTVRNRLINFQESENTTIYLSDINLNFSDKLIIWMSKNNYDPNTIHKTFVTLKTALNFLYTRREDLNITISDAFQKTEFGKVSTHESPPLPLSAQEFSKLFSFCQEVKYRNHTLLKTADVFLFQCATGLRYSDLFRVTKSHIKNNIILIEPVKTETTKKNNFCKIPLNYYSYYVLKKYNYSLQALKISNQKYNKNLKELFKLLQVNEEITVKEYAGLGMPVERVYKKWELISSHNARDTFITFCIKSGIDISSIMEMTGHRDYETMKKYIKLDDKHLIQVMNRFKAENFYDEEPEFKHNTEKYWIDLQRSDFLRTLEQEKKEKGIK